MPDHSEVWKEALPEIRKAVTGVGVWTALNASSALAVEDNVLVLGLPPRESELAGHLRMPQIRKVIEAEIGRRLGGTIELRVIEGNTDDDWQRAKRRDAEAKRMQEAAMTRARAEVTSRSNWDLVYETLSRQYASVSNKTMPQNRARFYNEALKLVAEHRKNQTANDEMGDRNFARCIERLAQYAEVPSTIVAARVLEIAGEI